MLTQRNLSDAGQVIEYLLLLVSQLRLIGQVLPFAAAAYAKMRAEGLFPFRTIGMEFDRLAFGVIVLLAGELDVHHVAWSDKGNEHDHVVYLGDRLTFGGDVRDSYLFQYR